MKRSLFVIIIASFLFLPEAISQHKIFEHSIDLKSFLSGVLGDTRDVFPVVSPTGDTLSLFMIDDKNIYGLLINKNQDVLKELSFAKPVETGFEDILGSVINGSKYTIFFSSGNKKIFSSFSIDFEKENSSTSFYDIKLKKERYLQSINVGGKFFLLSIKKKSSILNLLEFSNENSYSSSSYDFGHIMFSEGFDPELFYALKQVAPEISSPFAIERIADAPIGLHSTANPNKIYATEKNIILTVDHSRRHTILLNIDIDTHTSSDKIIEKPDLENSVSNSFIYKDKIVLGTANAEGCIIRIQNLKDDEILREFAFTQETEIPFQNGPIIQEGGTYFSDGLERELSKNKQLLRKIASSTLALAISEYDHEKVQITVGSFLKLPKGGGMTPGFGLASNLGYIPPTYNPVYYQYGSYVSTKSAYVSGLLEDRSFEPLEGPIAPTKFRQIKKYEDSLSSPKATTVFKWEKYIFGYYDKSSQKYFLLKF